MVLISDFESEGGSSILPIPMCVRGATWRRTRLISERLQVQILSDASLFLFDKLYILITRISNCNTKNRSEK